MVLIFSEKANSSRHIHREVQTAFEQDLTVIPFRVENTQPTGTMEYYLGSVHWLDALTAPVESHMLGVVERVKALLPVATVEPIVESVPPIPQPVPSVAPQPESQPPQRAESDRPQLEKASVAPPPPVTPLAVTSGPAAKIVPQVASSARKKMFQRVAMALVGLIAILYGARQVAQGLHLFSKTSSSAKPSLTAPAKSHEETLQEIEKTLVSLQQSAAPAATPKDPAAVAGDLEGAATQGCIIQYPKGWERKENSPVSTMFIAPKSSGLSANMILTSDQFAGTLRQYVDATMTAVKSSSPALRVVSDAPFASVFVNGYKMTVRNKIKDVEFGQTLYFFDGKPGTKVVITTSALSAQAAKLDLLFDRCLADLFTGALPR